VSYIYLSLLFMIVFIFGVVCVQTYIKSLIRNKGKNISSGSH